MQRRARRAQHHAPVVGCAATALPQQQPCSDRYRRSPMADSVRTMAATPSTMTIVSGVAM